MDGNSVDNSDPLAGADVGETRTVQESVELHTIDFEPDVFWGSDRIGSPEIESVDVVEDDHGDEMLVVSFEGELTKTLPRRWDSYREPLTPAEEKDARRKRWARKALGAGTVIAPMGIALLVSTRLMNSMAGVTINGEPVQPPGIESVLGVFAFALFVVWAIQWIPRGNGGRSA